MSGTETWMPGLVTLLLVGGLLLLRWGARWRADRRRRRETIHIVISCDASQAVAQFEKLERAAKRVIQRTGGAA